MTGVQTCALPIWLRGAQRRRPQPSRTGHQIPADPGVPGGDGRADAADAASRGAGGVERADRRKEALLYVIR